MNDAIGYLRVSTSEQGRSGLGLAAQRHDIETFGSREGFSVKSWYQDIQIGAGKDALLMRSGLAAALKEARALRSFRPIARLLKRVTDCFTRSSAKTDPVIFSHGMC
jgi:DNA invertase Pin-like site-specific DNA recombinase